MLALDPRTRYLPDVPASGYVVGGDEPLAAALHRLTTEQFSIAIDALSDPAADLGIATSATLKAMDRIAAVLRLVRSSIGDEAYRTELRILDETSELLGGLLEGQPELRALDQLRARYKSVLQPSAMAPLRSQLLHRHQLYRLRALSEGEAMQQTLHRLRRARARFAAWPVDDRTDARMYGREPVEDSFDALTTGLQQTYRRGRRQWKRIRGDETEAMGKWRSQVRHLGHQLEIVSTAWPEVVGATASACRQLELVLSEEHGLARLATVTSGDRSLVMDDVERSLLDGLVAHGRTELRSVADVLGHRLYIEPAGQFVQRLRAYWSARDLLH